VRRLTFALALIAPSLALAVPAGAATGPTAKLTLDSFGALKKHSKTRFVRDVAKTPGLLRGIPYVATVRGTYSGWRREQYTAKGAVVCGKPERRPLFPTPGAPNGRVGLDPQFAFATPVGGDCTKISLPASQARFQINAQGKYRYPAPLRPLTAPSASHAYRYPILGTGAAARFRIPDPFPLDNYGRFVIKVKRATAGDCAKAFAAWGYADVTSCQAAAARRPGKTWSGR
jgi:hypothetical protein